MTVGTVLQKSFFAAKPAGDLRKHPGQSDPAVTRTFERDCRRRSRGDL